MSIYYSPGVESQISCGLFTCLSIQ